MKRYILGLFALLIFVGTGPVQATTINASGGYIYSVDDFLFKGVTYDVGFKAGNYNNVFPPLPIFWNDTTSGIHQELGDALSDVFNGAHQGDLVRDGSTASSMFYIPIGPGNSAGLYDTEAFYNDPGTWGHKLTGADYGMSSVNGIFAVFTQTSAPVPEPATMLLFGLGLLGLAGVNRRKK